VGRSVNISGWGEQGDEDLEGGGGGG